MSKLHHDLKNLLLTTNDKFMTISKEILQKNIMRRAKKRVEQDLNSFVQACDGNPFLRNLVLINKAGEKIRFINFSGHTGGVIFNGCEPYGNQTNFEEIKSELIEKYIEKEVENLLQKLGSIEYLFEESEEEKAKNNADDEMENPFE